MSLEIVSVQRIQYISVFINDETGQTSVDGHTLI